METEFNRIPWHIAIIMDGNGRWARKRGLPAAMGHREGVRAVERVLEAAKRIGVKILTLYAFSTENWKRPEEEVSALMDLLRWYLSDKALKLKKDGVKLNVIGDITGLPEEVGESLGEVTSLTRGNTVFTLNLALNYGSRKEIVDAARSACRDAVEGRLDAGRMDEKIFSDYLYTRGMPDPDLLIRTSGEMRLSNFLLWQLSYTEIYISDTLWPDFSGNDLNMAVSVFQKRRRRFGGR